MFPPLNYPPFIFFSQHLLFPISINFILTKLRLYIHQGFHKLGLNNPQKLKIKVIERRRRECRKDGKWEDSRIDKETKTINSATRQRVGARSSNYIKIWCVLRHPGQIM